MVLLCSCKKVVIIIPFASKTVENDREQTFPPRRRRRKYEMEKLSIETKKDTIHP